MYEKQICNVCKGLKYLHAKGLCSNCYKRVGTPKIKCFKCNELKHHHAKNLCAKCYNLIYQLDNIKTWQKKKKNQQSIFK